MAKLKISQKQYDTIVLHEQISRLGAVKSNIIESTSTSKVLLKEGWKDVILGVALMLGVKLTGQNKEVAEKAIKDQKIMSEIKQTLEDEDKLAELADALGEKGMKNPENMLSLNPEGLVYDYNKIAKENGVSSTIGIKAALAMNSLGN